MTGRKAAIVTGAGSGIGRAIAQRLAEDGLAVAVLDLNDGAAERVGEEIRQKGQEAVVLGGVDVSKRPQVDDAVGRAR